MVDTNSNRSGSQKVSDVEPDERGHLMGLWVVALVVIALFISTLSPHDHEDEAGGHDVHWGYDGKSGPAQWGSLKSEYLACGGGRQQSPIDIDTGSALRTQVGDIEFSYQPTPLVALNNGHTIQVNYAPGSVIRVSGHTYELLQFHFHSPSEHKINNKYSDMEVHLVHKDQNGDLAVVGVMLEKGADNALLKSIWKNIPRDLNKPKKVAGATANANDLLPADRTAFYHYMGSLTTPPCSEVVSWFVMKEAISLSNSQVAKLTDTVGSNNRPVQPLHRRHVLKSKSSSQ